MNRRSFLFSGAAVAFLAGTTALWRMGAPTDARAESFEVTKTEEEWRVLLSEAQYAVLREEDTEPAGTSPLNNEKRKGTFHCAGCDLPLYPSETKYESGTGWPRSIAAAAAAILATYSTTAPRRPASATASTGWL
jgi:peptide-methionine (R)-S-oxide reductase